MIGYGIFLLINTYLKENINKGKNFYIPLNDDNIVLVDINKKMIIAKPIKGIIDNV